LGKNKLYFAEIRHLVPFSHDFFAGLRDHSVVSKKIFFATRFKTLYTPGFPKGRGGVPHLAISLRLCRVNKKTFVLCIFIFTIFNSS
jgi:hypothetical protein